MVEQKTETKTEEKRKYTYRGKTIEELKELNVREFAKFLKSRQRRFVLRKFQEIEKFVELCKEKVSNNKSIRTHKRDLIVVPALVGMKIHIHDGRNFVPIQVTEEMMGHKFGEFAPTRAKVKHGKAGIGATKGSKAQAKK